MTGQARAFIHPSPRQLIEPGLLLVLHKTRMIIHVKSGRSVFAGFAVGWCLLQRSLMKAHSTALLWKRSFILQPSPWLAVYLHWRLFCQVDAFCAKKETLSLCLLLHELDTSFWTGPRNIISYHIMLYHIIYHICKVDP